MARGLSAQEAARSAGYAPGYARKASRLLKFPVIAKAVAEISSDARRETVYTLLEDINEIDKAVLFESLSGRLQKVGSAHRRRQSAEGLTR